MSSGPNNITSSSSPSWPIKGPLTISYFPILTLRPSFEATKDDDVLPNPISHHQPSILAPRCAPSDTLVPQLKCGLITAIQFIISNIDTHSGCFDWRMAKQYKGTAFTTQILSNAKESHIDNVMVFGLFLFYEIFMSQIQYNPIFECNWTRQNQTPSPCLPPATYSLELKYTHSS